MQQKASRMESQTDIVHLEKSNQIKYYIFVRPKVDQRAYQLCLPHIEITKTDKNTTKT